MSKRKSNPSFRTIPRLAGVRTRAHCTVPRGHPLYVARADQAQLARFEPYVSKTVGRNNVRRLRPSTPRVGLRPMGPRLGEPSSTESCSPPIDGILRLVEQFERGEIPPRT